MHKEIQSLLHSNKRLKAKTIAKKLGLEKREVNSFLHNQTSLFIQDEEYFWSSADELINIKLEDCNWVDCNSFEKSLSESGNPLKSTCKSFLFTVPNDCKIYSFSFHR